MRQFEFLATPWGQGSRHSIRATARTVDIARWHIVDRYGIYYDISDYPIRTHAPHAILGEIDCTNPGAETVARRG